MSSPVWMPAVPESMSSLPRAPAMLLSVDVPVPVRSLVVGFHAYATLNEMSRVRTRKVKKAVDAFLAEP